MTTTAHRSLPITKRLTIAVYSAAFLSGFVTMALEMLIGRTFIPFFGGTIYTWGALISIFLTGMTLGYVLGGKAADRNPSGRIVAGLFVASAIFVVIVPVYGEGFINRILDSIEDVRYAALLAALTLACLPAASLAAVSPYCVRLILDRKDHSGTISGRLSGLTTAGSIIGTIGTSFFFIPSLGVKSIYGILAGISIVIGVVFWKLGTNHPQASHAQRSSVLLAVLLLSALAGPFGARQVAAQPQPSLIQRDGLLEKVESEYNTIFVQKEGPFISLNFGYRANRYTESVMDLTRPGELVVTYTRYMTSALAFHQGKVERIALVGLGGGRTISYLIGSLPGVIADVAELDPAVIALASKYFGVNSTERLRIHNQDGRVFLARTKEKFDLVLLDAYRGPFVPFHLTTQEFYRVVKSRLREGGVVAQNVEPTTLFFDSTLATMKTVFDSVDAVEAGGNIVLIGYSGTRLPQIELSRLASATQAKLRLKYDLNELVKARKDVRSEPNAKILTDDFSPVEMLKTVKRHNEKKQ